MQIFGKVAERYRAVFEYLGQYVHTHLAAYRFAHRICVYQRGKMFHVEIIPHACGFCNIKLKIGGGNIFYTA